MWKGHGCKIRAGLRSTRQPRQKRDNEEEAAHSEESQENNDMANERAYYTTTFNLKSEMDQKLYSDQTGRFPTMSYKGSQYIFVLFDMDTTNAIMVKPMRN